MRYLFNIPEVPLIGLDIPKEYNDKVMKALEGYCISTIKALHERMTEEEYRQLNWNNTHMFEANKERRAVYEGNATPRQIDYLYLCILEGIASVNEGNILQKEESEILVSELGSLIDDIYSKFNISDSKKFKKENGDFNIPELMEKIIDKSIERGIYYGTDNNHSNIIIPGNEMHIVLSKRNPGRLVTRNDEGHEMYTMYDINCSEKIAETLNFILEDIKNLDVNDKHYTNMVRYLTGEISPVRHYIPTGVRKKLLSGIEKICSPKDNRENRDLYREIKEFYSLQADLPHDMPKDDYFEYEANIGQELSIIFFNSCGYNITLKLAEDEINIRFPDHSGMRNMKNIKVTPDNILISNNRNYRKIDDTERQTLEIILEDINDHIRQKYKKAVNDSETES